MFRRWRQFVNGFTLVELLVVIAIIGMLAALLLPGLSKSKAQGCSTTCKNHLRQMGLALEMYVHESGNKYPYLLYGPPAFHMNDAVNAEWFAKLSPYYPIKWTDQAYHCPGYKGAISVFAESDHDPLGSYAYNDRGIGSYDSLAPAYLISNLGLGGVGGPGRNVPAISESQVIAPGEMFAIGESRHRGERGVPNESCVFAMFCGNIGGSVPYYGKPPLPERHGKDYQQLFCDGHVASMNPLIVFNPTDTAAMWNNDHQPHPELWIGLDFY